MHTGTTASQITKELQVISSFTDFQQEQQLKWVASRRENNNNDGIGFLLYFKQTVWKEVTISTYKSNNT